jgi:hypothetical protein
MLIGSALHDIRGAMFPALKSVDLTDEETRRAWTAMLSGSWKIKELLEAWIEGLHTG